MSSGTAEMLGVSRADGVLTVTLNRPEVRNALHPEQLRALLEVIAGAAEDTELRLLAITGAGEEAFSAGFDVKVLRDAGSEGPPPSEILFEATAALAACPVPTLAAIRGYCVGAGLDLAMACDHRIATDDALLFLPAAKLGTVYEPRSLERIQAIVGGPVAKRLVICGHRFGAPEARAAGLLDEIVAGGAMRESLHGWVGAKPDNARAHKRILDALAAAPPRPAEFWAPLDELRSRSTGSAERREAIDRFTDSRPSGGAQE